MLETAVRDVRNTRGTRTSPNPVVNGLVCVSSRMGVGVLLQNHREELIKVSASPFKSDKESQKLHNSQVKCLKTSGVIETTVRDARNTGGTRSSLNPVVDSLVRVSSQMGIGVSFQEELLQKVQNEATL